MIMAPGFRKIALVTHIISSVGSLGAVAGFLALAGVGLTSQDIPAMRSPYVAMEVIALFVVVPLVFTSLLTGLVQALGTTWGLFRHYWVLVKLLLTLFTLIVLLLQMEGISYMATASTETTLLNTDLLGLRRSLVIHAAGGLVVLLLTTMLSVYKPRGMTRYGWRKHQEWQGGRR
jgi:ABC-type transport system involved in cytochrome c biogenesis permease subunit